MAVSIALGSPAYTPERFLAKFTNKVDPFGHTYLEQDLDDAVCTLHPCAGLSLLIGHSDISCRHPKSIKSFFTTPNLIPS